VTWAWESKMQTKFWWCKILESGYLEDQERGGMIGVHYDKYNGNKL
jgi:hypothetical protein